VPSAYPPVDDYGTATRWVITDGTGFLLQDRRIVTDLPLPGRVE
jgi:hypothetical protein